MKQTIVSMVCPACGCRRCVDHCDETNRQCTWWKCFDCASFGSKLDARYVDARPKDKR